MKIKYYYGIKGRPKTYGSKVFTIEEIEQGKARSDMPILRRELLSSNLNNAQG